MQGYADSGPWSAGKFQPAPSIKNISDTQTTHRRARNFLILFGSFVLALLLIVPIWDAGLMLEDPIYVFFLGRESPKWIIITCCSAIAFWILMVLLFFGCAREEAHTEMSMVSMACILMTALGVALLLQSNVLISESRTVINDLNDHCGSSIITQNLTAYSTVLQVLRQQPNCIDKESIEECKGYENAPPWTGMLKTMENYLKCAGFCYMNHNVTAAEIQTPAVSLVEGTSSSLGLKVKQASLRLKAEETALFSKHHHEHFETSSQRSVTGAFDGDNKDVSSRTHTQRKWQKDHDPGIFLLSAGETVEQETVAKVASQGGRLPADPRYWGNVPYPIYTYPPTLFSDANYHASCDGMAARDLEFTALKSGSYIYVEGLIIVCSAVALSLGKLLSTCAHGQVRKLNDRQRYGTVVL